MYGTVGTSATVSCRIHPYSPVSDTDSSERSSGRTTPRWADLTPTGNGHAAPRKRQDQPAHGPQTPRLTTRAAGPCDQVFPQVTARALPRRTPSGTMLRVGPTRSQRAPVTRPLISVDGPRTCLAWHPTAHLGCAAAHREPRWFPPWPRDCEPTWSAAPSSAPCVPTGQDDARADALALPAALAGAHRPRPSCSSGPTSTGTSLR